MMRFVEKPNLPSGKAAVIICGTDDERILSYFVGKGITVINNAPNESIDSAVSTHADMAAIHLGADRIIMDKSQTALSAKLKSQGMSVFETKSCISGDYPQDIALNFTLIGDKMFGKIPLADEVLMKEAEDFEKVSVNQGYCKCSVLVVDEKSLITDDEGIHRKALEKGVDSLLVSKGDVSLNGHTYGFIGGASGKISNDRVVFFGNIENHRDFEKIRAFLLSHGCFYECTDEGPLRDIGGIIPITEEI